MPGSVGCSAAGLSEFVPAGCSSSGCAGVVGLVTSEFVGSPVDGIATSVFFSTTSPALAIPAPKNILAPMTTEAAPTLNFLIE